MGFFDNLAPGVQDALTRSMIGMGSSMLVNKDRGLAQALGLGLNSGLQQFDRGMAIATEAKRYEQKQQQIQEAIARRNAENLRRDAQAMLVADIQARNQRDLAETRFGYQKQLQGMTSPKDQAVIETQRLRQQQIEQDLEYNNWLRDMTREGKEKEAQAVLDKLEEESKPGLFSRIFSSDDDEGKKGETPSTTTTLPSLQRKLLQRSLPPATQGRALTTGSGTGAEEELKKALSNFASEAFDLTPQPRTVRDFNINEGGVADSQLMRFLRSIYGQ